MVSRANHTPRLTVVKRVLGLEGDTVQVPYSTRDGPAHTVKASSGCHDHQILVCGRPHGALRDWSVYGLGWPKP